MPAATLSGGARLSCVARSARAASLRRASLRADARRATSLRGPFGVGGLIASLVFGAGGMGCVKNHIYGPEVAPVVVEGELYLPRPNGPERRTVRRLHVADSPAEGWRLPTVAERERLASGQGPDWVRVGVDNSQTIWRDWALTGFGVTFCATFGLLTATGVVDFGGDRGEIELGLGLLVSSLLALEVGLVAALFGELFEGQDVREPVGFAP